MRGPEGAGRVREFRTLRTRNGAALASAVPLEHFQEKWNPVFRPEMPRNKELECFRVSKKREKALDRQCPLPRDILSKRSISSDMIHAPDVINAKSGVYV